MDEVQEQFDDPALRRALQRAMCKTPAPMGLRDKVAAMMASTPALARAGDNGSGADASPSRWRIPRIPARTAAAAAIAFIALGFAFAQIAQELDLFSGSSQAMAPVQFEEPFARAMVQAHRTCAGAADHHLVAGNDFTALRSELTKVEGIKVFAAKLGDDWEFKGGGICTVGDKKVAHLVFTRGEQSASVFSIPQPEHSCGESTYDQLFDNSAILGFSRENALYTVVVSRTDGKPAKSKHCKSLLTAVYADIAKCAPVEAQPTTGASQ